MEPLERPLSGRLLGLPLLAELRQSHEGLQSTPSGQIRIRKRTSKRQSLSSGRHLRAAPPLDGSLELSVTIPYSDGSSDHLVRAVKKVPAGRNGRDRQHQDEADPSACHHDFPLATRHSLSPVTLNPRHLSPVE